MLKYREYVSLMNYMRKKRKSSVDVIFEDDYAVFCSGNKTAKIKNDCTFKNAIEIIDKIK